MVRPAGKNEFCFVKHFTIVQMNDSHAYLELHPELFWECGQTVYRPAGGYARIATLLQQIRADAPGHVLFIDGGEPFHGTYPAVETKGRALVPVLNALAPAAMTAHWEFAYTPQGFKDLSRSLRYPMPAINVYEKDSSRLPVFVTRAGTDWGTPSERKNEKA